MHLLFFQNCISPHQMPYIEALCDFEQVKGVYVIVPRVTYDYRANLGWPESWTQSRGKLHIMLTPTDQEVQDLLNWESASGESMVYAFFSGITAFPEVKHWFKLSLRYDKLQRGIITEAPFAKGKKWLLWLHRLHFLLTDYRYIHHVKFLFAIGEDCVSYYRSWSKHWKIIPFMYCTQPLLSEEELQTVSEGEKDRMRILFAGSLEPRKNVPFLLDALKGVGFGYELSIVGDGVQRTELESRVKEMNIQANFLGAQPNREVAKMMAGHDILILPSLHDGWGAVINEAALAGTLTACSDQCGARIIADYVFSLEKPDQLTEILRRIALTLSEKRQLREERRLHAMSQISPAAVAQKMMDGIQM